jgi:hypothetical protein
MLIKAGLGCHPLRHREPASAGQFSLKPAEASIFRLVHPLRDPARRFPLGMQPMSIAGVAFDQAEEPVMHRRTGEWPRSRRMNPLAAATVLFGIATAALLVAGF